MDKNKIRNEIIHKLNLNNIDMYDEFDDIIKKRGEKIYQDNKIKILTSVGNKYKAIVQGTEDYNVEVEFDKDNSIKKMKCTCPYYNREDDSFIYDRGSNCKHIYSVVFATKLKDNYEKIKQYDNDELKKIKTRYTNSNVKNDLLEGKIRKYEQELGCNLELNRYLDIAVSIYVTNEELSDEIYETKMAAKKLKERYEEEIQEKEIRQRHTVKRKKHKPGLIFGLLSGLLSVSNNVYKETHDSKEYTEEELNDWDLTEEQKQLVREGHFEPWNFEEDKKSLEEEDYFYEDDE